MISVGWRGEQTGNVAATRAQGVLTAHGDCNTTRRLYEYDRQSASVPHYRRKF